MSSPRMTHNKPHPLWAMPTDTATAIPITASTAIGAGAPRPPAAPAGQRRTQRPPRPEVRSGCWEDLAGDPPAHPRSEPKGPAPLGLRTPRPSAFPPGNVHSGRTGPHRGRHRKPSPQQWGSSPAWRSSGCRPPSRTALPRAVVSGFRICLISWAVGHHRQCPVPPAGDDICHRSGSSPATWVPPASPRATTVLAVAPGPLPTATPPSKDLMRNRPKTPDRRGLRRLDAGIAAVEPPRNSADTISKPAASSIGSSSHRKVLNSVRMCSARPGRCGGSRLPGSVTFRNHDAWHRVDRVVDRVAG